MAGHGIYWWLKRGNTETEKEYVRGIQVRTPATVAVVYIEDLAAHGSSDYGLEVTKRLFSLLHMRSTARRPAIAAAGNPPPGITQWPAI